MFKFNSQKQRLIFWFLSISIIPLVITFGYTYFNQKSQIKEQEIEKLTAIRDLKVREINNWLGDVIHDLNILSQDNRLLEFGQLLKSNQTSDNYKFSLENALKVLNRWHTGYDYSKEVIFIDASNGKVVLSTKVQLVDSYVNSEKYFTACIANKQVYIKDIYRDETTDEPEMLFAAPVYDFQQKNIVAIVAVKVNLESSLYKIMLNRTGMGETGETLIVNEEVYALNELRWYENAPLNLKIMANPAVKSAKGITGIEHTTDYRGVEVYTAYTHIEKTNWGFVAKRDVKEVNQAINKLSLNFFIILLLTIVFLFFVARWIAQSISKPIVDISKITNELEKGNYKIRNKINSKDEIGFLASSINQMADKIENQDRVQRGRQKITDVLISCTDLNEFWKGISRALIDISRANTCVCYAIVGNGDVFKAQYSIGINSEMLIDFSGSNLEGEFGNVISTKKITIQNELKSSQITRIRTTVADYIPEEMISIPLIMDNKVEGIISLSKNSKFMPELVEVLNQTNILLNSSYSNILTATKTQILAKELSISYDKLSVAQAITEHQNEELQSQSNELISQSQELQSQNIELEAQSRQVEEANRMKSEFLSNMSHELRTPLNSIMALSRVLLMNTKEKLSSEEVNYLEIIERNGKNLLQLINSILDLSKIEAGKIDFSISQFDLNTVIRLMSENISAPAHDKGLKIILDLDDALPNIESDDSKIMQILQNIIGNAIKFTEKGHIKISSRFRDGLIHISVKDTGIGIPDHALSYIFEEFKQVDGSISRKFEGSGLGLAIAKKTATMLKGDISVHSIVNEGTEFIIRLPVNWNGAKPIEKFINQEPEIHSLARKSILIVDDEPFITRLIAENLQKAGYNTYEAHSGKEAIELSIKIKPFAITLDLMMPEIDGYEVMQELKKHAETESIPVIIVSISKNKDTAMALGAVGYISKPILKEELLKEIRKISYQAMNILIVDDNEIERKNVANFLKEESYTITEANDGIHCLDVLQSKLPDAIVLDLIMPGLDGFKVIEHLKNSEQTANIPVIITTAKDLNEDERELLFSKAFSILEKNHLSSQDTMQLIKQELVRIADRYVHPQISKMERILIVEDNEAAIIQIKSVLEKEGYFVNIAKGGQQAIDFVKHTIPDAIILDLMMPEVDGFQVLEIIRGTEKTRHIPVLILTAKNLTKDDLKVLSTNNVQQLIQKGDINRDELVLKVALALGKSQESDETKKTGITEIEKKQKIPVSMNLLNNSIPKILIIEDNPDNLTTITAILKASYQLVLAASAKSGIAFACSEKPDLILLDMMLPEMSGIEVLKILKDNENIKHIPIIALTAQAMKGDRERILEAGCDDYMSKPIDPLALLELVEKWINQ